MTALGDQIIDKVDVCPDLTAELHFNTLYIYLVSHLQQGTVYSLIKCVSEYTVVEWPHTFDE